MFLIRCDSKFFGVPQTRARLYVVGVRHAELHPTYAGRSVEVLSHLVEETLKTSQTHTSGGVSS